MTFKKGPDPNRAPGRPRLKDGEKSLPCLARERTSVALATLDRIMMNPKAREETQLKAAVKILEFGWGRAEQSINITKTTEHQHLVATVDVSKLSLDALRQLANASLNEPIEGEILPGPDDEQPSS